MTRHSDGVAVVVLWWWFCCVGGSAGCGDNSFLVNMENYNDPPVALTLRSKLSLIKVIRKKIRNTRREVLFRKTYFGWLLDIDESQENCILIHFMSCRKIESLKDDKEVVPFTYAINGHEIQFGREEFCLITGLRFGVEFSDDYLYGPLDFRRRVWESHVDGSNIIGEMLINKIHSEEFYSLRDEDVVAVCLLAVLHMVLLGQEPKNNVLNWWLRLVDDLNMWEKYPWGSYIWPKLYVQLKDANGAEPIGRLRADAFEAKAEWWVSSRAFFDGRICEPPQIPPAVQNDIYQRVAEQGRSIKELQQQNVDQYKILNSMNKNFKGLNASCMPGPMKASFKVRKHFGLNDLSGFQNTECGPQLFTAQASGSFFEGAQTTSTYSCTPHIGTPMAQPGFASCSFRYPPSHPGTPYVGTPLALQGFAPFSSNYQAGPSHNRDVFGLPLEEEVMLTSSCATDEYLSFYNVDPTKVVRGRYVDCMTFFNAPESVFWDCYIKGYTVGVQFWQELVPLLCKGGFYEHQKLSEQINCWMELIIRARPPGARNTMAKTGMASLHPGTQKFILETDEHIIGMLDGSSRPYLLWDDVDIVYMPLHCNGNHWVTCVINLPSSTIHVVDSLPNDDRYRTLNAHLSKWTSVLNVML
ncbi:phospholipase-like protein [Tanacetum coccineum]